MRELSNLVIESLEQNKLDFYSKKAANGSRRVI